MIFAFSLKLLFGVFYFLDKTGLMSIFGFNGNQTLMLIDGIRPGSSTVRKEQYFKTLNVFNNGRIVVLSGSGFIQMAPMK